MGVKVKFHKDAWWVFIHHGAGGVRRRSAITTANEVARRIRERLALGDLSLLASEPAETFEAFATRWPEGTHLDGDNVRHRVFYRLLTSAKLREIRFHDLRHTFASLLIQNGEPLTYVKEQMGHSSIQVTVDIYGHLVPSANRAAVDKLDALPARNPDATDAQNADANVGGK